MNQKNNQMFARILVNRDISKETNLRQDVSIKNPEDLVHSPKVPEPTRELTISSLKIDDSRLAVNEKSANPVQYYFQTC